MTREMQYNKLNKTETIMTNQEFRKLIREEIQKVLKEESVITAELTRRTGSTTLHFGVSKNQYNRIKSKLNSLIKQKLLPDYDMLASSSFEGDESGVFASWKRGRWRRAEDKQNISALKSVGINVLVN